MPFRSPRVITIMAESTVATNRKAFHEYHVLETLEAGIQLLGSEIKSIRARGGLSFKDSYVEFRKGEAWLVGAHIPPYEMANRFNHEPERDRKLLLHRREINRWAGKSQERGLAVVPLKCYFKRGKLKVQIGLCQGKKLYDKRETIRRRDDEREAERAMKEWKR